MEEEEEDGGKLTSCHMFPGCEVKVALLLLITPGRYSQSLNVTNGVKERERERERSLIIIITYISYF